ncbi:integrator complex subunit 10-like [Tigriopus californicus]|nr:integrator complex subunit 10-like [Tigriopus californicus]|eukprot:TCALIF_07453-PA protein Name:"Similar to Ints10 Integrator complex subunit 10 (Mus musculus)" AED:0.35 eAED:0.35 QI:0/-1/0/1/-1/1/1/0/670
MGVKTREGDLSHLNDVDYLVSRSKELRVKDPDRSKSWMLTAQMMFPKNFAIQYEAYQVEKTAGNAMEAGKFLKHLFEHFHGSDGPSEAVLLEEIHQLVTGLQNQEATRDEPDILGRIFEQLPTDTRKKILLESASKANDTLTYAKQFMLAFTRFPELIPSYGSNFLSVVVSKCPTKSVSVDPLLELLVKEACPQLLGVTQLKIEVSMLDDILYHTIDYLSHQVLAARNQLKDGASTNSPSDIWVIVFGFLEEIGQRMGWSLTEDLNEVLPEVLWQRVHSFSQQNVAKQDSEAQNQLFFLATILFLRSLSEFATDSWEQTLEPAILVEAFIAHQSEETKPKNHPKRRRTTEDERRFPLVTHGDRHLSNGEHPSVMVASFLRAYRYYDLIHSEPGLNAMFQQLRGITQTLASFCVDVAQYQGRFRDALSILRSQPTPHIPAKICRNHVKLATIQFSLGEYHATADHLIEAVANLPPVISENEKPNLPAILIGSALKQPSAVKTRHVHFLPFTRHHILAYCARILIYILKDRALQPTSPNNDITLGHVLVLLQYIFPEEKDLMLMMVHKIKQKDAFSYPLFSSYIVQIELLEEFAHLLGDPTCKVALDLSPSGGLQSGNQSQRRVGTRGANRGEKEEVRTAIVKQVAKSQEPLDELLISFLEENHDSILECLQ